MAALGLGRSHSRSNVLSFGLHASKINTSKPDHRVSITQTYSEKGRDFRGRNIQALVSCSRRIVSAGTRESPDNMHLHMQVKGLHDMAQRDGSGRFIVSHTSITNNRPVRTLRDTRRGYSINFRDYLTQRSKEYCTGYPHPALQYGRTQEAETCCTATLTRQSEIDCKNFNQHSVRRLGEQ